MPPAARRRPAGGGRHPGRQQAGPEGLGQGQRRDELLPVAQDGDAGPEAGQAAQQVPPGPGHPDDGRASPVTAATPRPGHRSDLSPKARKETAAAMTNASQSTDQPPP